MRNIIIFALAMVIGAGVCEATYSIIAKDGTPGGLYVFGADISPDSTALTMLYYSPDAGSTLILKDTLGWASYAGGPYSIAADSMEGIVYLGVIGGGHSSSIWISYDYGISWERRIEDFLCQLYSGNYAGEIILGVWRFSTDFGESVLVGDRIGLPLTNPCVYAGGTERGEHYYVNAEDYGYKVLYHTIDYGNTFAVIDSNRGFYMTAANLPGELWGLKDGSLLYSTDHGSTFVELTTWPIGLGGDGWGFLKGINPGTLYVGRNIYNVVPMVGTFGGNVTICHTENYGEEFICITHDADGIHYEVICDINHESIPQKPQSFSLTAFPNPFNSSVAITAPAGAEIEIFDLRGNVVTPYSSRQRRDSFVPLDKGDRNRASAKVSGGSASAQGVYIWTPDETISSGIYLVKATVGNNTATKKLVLIR